MRVAHYFEWEQWITGGHSQSVRNQRKILEHFGIDYTTEPDLTADLLHLNNMGPKSVHYARKAQKLGIPVVIHTHQTANDFRGGFAFSDLLARPLEPYLRYAYSLADHLICPSDYNRREVEEYTDVEKTVISNGVDTSTLEGYETLRTEYLDRYDLEPPVVFMVGHVMERKGLQAFVRTARALPDLDFAWFGYINPLGGGLAGRVLESRTVRRTIQDSPENCTFTGYIEDIRGGFAAGDIFFFPTKNENEGIALLEAMACGKPVLVRDIQTFDWLDHEENCLKTDTGFHEELNRLRDPELRERLGNAAYKKSTEFKLDSVGAQIIDLYESLVGE